MMVADYKETKIAADKLEKHIEELHKQLASLRGKQNKLGAGLGTKTKATFLVQNMVVASRPALEIAEAFLHQGMLLQQEISTKKAGLQKTLRKLGLQISDFKSCFPAKSLLRVSILLASNPSSSSSMA
ncbi:unnamed protein product [Prunus armeniaca]